MNLRPDPLSGVPLTVRGPHSTTVSDEAERCSRDTEQLTEFVQQGSDEAFTGLVRRHVDFVHATCRRLLDDPQLVDDAVQTTFLILLRKAPSLLQEHGLSKWLYYTARNASMTIRRQEQRRRRHERVVARLPAKDSVSSGAESDGPLLDAALEGLPQAQRDAIILHLLRGMTFADAARELQCPLRTVQTRVNRGLHRLRAALVAHGELSLNLVPALFTSCTAPSTTVAQALAVAHAPLKASVLSAAKIVGTGSSGLKILAAALLVAAVTAGGIAGGIILSMQPPAVRLPSLPPPATVAIAPAMPASLALPVSRLVALPPTMLQPSDNIFALAFTGEGHLVAAGPTTVVWDPLQSRQITTMAQHGRSNWVATSLDGSLIATSGDGTDRMVRFWDQHGQLLGTGTGHENSVWEVTFAPDGRTAASGSDDASVRIWQVPDGQCLHVLKGHSEAVTSVAFSPDGRTLVSGANDNQVILWDLASQTPLWTYRHTSNIHSLRFTSDGQAVVTGDGQGRLSVIGVRDGTLLRCLPAHCGKVLCLALSHDGRWLAMGAEDGQLVLWDTRDWAINSHIQLPEEVVACAFAHDDHSIATGSYGNAIRMIAIHATP